MNDYLLNRLRNDAEHTLAQARNEAQLQHQGLKGRFRELLIDNLLASWLPPYVLCGTGMIIAAENKKRQNTQDDIIIYDRSLAPPILASPNHAPEGVFLYNTVIARIEVKSSLTRDGVRTFVQSSREINDLRISVQPGFSGQLVGAVNLLFAFDSDAEGKGDSDYQLRRLFEVMRDESVDPLSGKVSMICVPGHGFWKLGIEGEKRCWQRLTTDKKADHVVWFLGCVSNTC